MKPPIFNDYNDLGYRTSITGSRSSKIEDDAIVYNCRYRWPQELKDISDVQLVNEYHEFALSDMFGNNDERFIEWIHSGE